ncbi:MAG: S1 RNA-binding domain-containing protein [Anaerolineales bacterium]
MIQPLGLEWRELKKDMAIKGKVSKVEKFGAFIELGAERPGLLHVSEMSHDYVKRPEDVVSVGQEVEVKVLEVNRRKKQIKLSMKALQAEPVIEPKAEKSQKAQRSQKAPEVVEEEPEKPAPTAMEVAMRRAMSDEQEEEVATKGKILSRKESSAVMEEILSRTLEHRPK